MLFYLKEILQRALAGGVPFTAILNLITHSMSWTFSYTVPMSTLLAIIVTVGNFNELSEITAMRAGGLSFGAILKPYLILGILLSILSLIYYHTIVPSSYRRMSEAIHYIHKYYPTALIKPGVFRSLSSGGGRSRVIFVEEKKNKDGKEIMKNIQIRTFQKVDNWKKVTEFIVARRGEKVEKISPDGQRVKAIRLYEGYAIMRKGDRTNTQKIDFQNGHFDLHLVDSENSFRLGKKPSVKEITTQTLLVQLDTLKKENAPREHYFGHIVEYHKRIALPFAPLFFILLGFPLAIAGQRTGKGFGFGFSVLFIFLYFGIFFAVDALAFKLAFIPVFLIVWLPNLIMFSIAIYLFQRRLR